MTVSAAHAALRLAQGAGRLVRRSSDRGVVAVLDSRLATARYAGFLRASLPPFWVTTDHEVAVGALRRLGELLTESDRPAARPRRWLCETPICRCEVSPWPAFASKVPANPSPFDKDSFCAPDPNICAERSLRRRGHRRRHARRGSCGHRRRAHRPVHLRDPLRQRRRATPASSSRCRCRRAPAPRAGRSCSTTAADGARLRHRRAAGGDRAGRRAVRGRGHRLPGDGIQNGVTGRHRPGRRQRHGRRVPVLRGRRSRRPRARRPACTSTDIGVAEAGTRRRSATACPSAATRRHRRLRLAAAGPRTPRARSTRRSTRSRRRSSRAR